jgi:hypothetical protein
MRRAFLILGAGFLLYYCFAEWTGFEPFGGGQAGAIPPSARNSGGYRSYHFWAGGK